MASSLLPNPHRPATGTRSNLTVISRRLFPLILGQAVPVVLELNSIVLVPASRLPAMIFLVDMVETLRYPPPLMDSNNLG